MSRGQLMTAANLWREAVYVTKIYSMVDGPVFVLALVFVCLQHI